MPKKKKNSRKKSGWKKPTLLVWFALVLGLAGLAAYAGIYLEKNTTIQEVQFTGNYFTPEEALFESIISPVGLMADSVDYRALFTGIRELPYVDDVTVNMSILGTLTFRINEHEPIAMLVDGARRLYISESGVLLPIETGKIRNVPLLYGFSAANPADTLNSDAFKQVNEFLKAARTNDVGWVTISEIAWNGQEGVVALTHENGVRLVFGKNDFEEKIRNWEAFYAEVISRKGIRSFTSIDLRFKDQIVTKNS